MTVRLDVVSAYARLPSSSPAANYARIAILPDPAGHHRPCVQIALVVDTSSSMRGHIGDFLSPRKIDLVKSAAKDVVAGLRDGDAFCLVAFSERAAVVVPAQVLSTDRAALFASIDGLETHGGTSMARGIGAALEQMRSLPSSAAVRTLVVLTDGQTPDEARCRRLAEATDVPFVLAGIGDDYNRHLLDEMAHAARGSNTYIDRPGAVASFFSRMLVEAQDTVLTRATLQMDFAARFSPRRLHQIFPDLRAYTVTPITASDRQTTVGLGDIRREGMVLLLEYAYVGGAMPGRRRVAGLDLRYDQPPLTGLSVASDAFALSMSEEPGFSPLDPALREAIAYAAVETAQARLLHSARTGDLGLTLQWLQVIDARLQSVGADATFLEATTGAMNRLIAAGETPEALAESAAAKHLTSGVRRLARRRVGDLGR